MIDKALAARKLSGALGRHISPDEVIFVGAGYEIQGRTFFDVELDHKVWWTLSDGNEASGGPDETEHWRNGKRVE